MKFLTFLSKVIIIIVFTGIMLLVKGLIKEIFQVNLGYVGYILFFMMYFYTVKRIWRFGRESKSDNLE